MALPSAASLKSLINFIVNGEPTNAEVSNRPTVDLIDALAGENGVFQSLEDLASFGSIQKSTHVTNDTGMVLHFDNGASSVVGQQSPTTIVDNTTLIKEDSGGVIVSKFEKSMDLGAKYNVPTVPSGLYYEYENLITTQAAVPSDSPIQGTISFWAKPYSIGTSYDVWGFQAEAVDYPFIAAYGGPVPNVQTVSGRIAPVTTNNYFEIGFSSAQKYFYTRVVGGSGEGSPNGDFLLAEPTGSWPIASEFSDKWYNLVFTWHLDNTPALDSDKIFIIKFYVDGDLVASNKAIGAIGRFTEVFDFSQKLQIHSGNWLIDEVRYDQRVISDEEAFAWYQSDVPFIHNVEAITPSEFGHLTADQLIKAIASGAPSGSYDVQYHYGVDNSPPWPEEWDGFVWKIIWDPGGTYNWKASVIFDYIDNPGNSDHGFLYSEYYTIEANGNSTSAISTQVTFTYNGNNFLSGKLVITS